MTKEEIAAILKEMRNNAGMTQREAAQKIGRKQQTLASWEIGQSQPDANTLFQLCSLYGTSVDKAFGFDKTLLDKLEFDVIKKYRALDGHGKTIVDFVLNEEYQRMTSTPKPAEAESNVIRLDFSEQPCSAGRGTYFGPDAFSEIRVEENALTKRASFAVPVSGDSMEPTYSDGDILLVDKNVEVSSGEIGLFILDGEGYVKKLGKKELLSLNPAYPPISLEDSIRCCGKVIGLLQKDWMK